jgi:hypothetical protein
MKVVSFDVGIKNLAVCILEYDDSSNIKIIYWDVINLLDNNAIKIVLPCSIPNCKQKIKSYIEIEENKFHFCTKHLSEKDKYTKPITDKYDLNLWSETLDLCTSCLKSASDSNKEVSELKEKKIKPKKNNYNKELNLTLCNKHQKQIIEKINKLSNKIISIKAKKVKDHTVDDIKIKLIKSLDAIKDILLLEGEIVLIENQPSFKNPTMKAISDTLYCWFLIRGLIDKDLNKSTLDKIKFISPSGKLRDFCQTTIDEAKTSNKYKETKKLSIENTKNILGAYELNNWLKHILESVKKDDLADCFLQGWSYMNSLYNNKLYDEWSELYEAKKLVLEEDVPEIVLEEIISEKPKKKRVVKKKINIDFIPEKNILDLTSSNDELVLKKVKKVKKAIKLEEI